MLHRLLRLLRCPHDGLYKALRRTGLVLVCEDCGREFPVALTDRAKAKRLAQRMARSKAEPASEFMRARQRRA